MRDSADARPSDLDSTVFSWFLALAVLFQLARGDMGLFPELRNTPTGWTLGDGVVPQVWFCAALVTLAFPTNVWSVTLLSLAGLFDFWWRLPIVTPSLYFQALVSAEVVLAAGWVLVRRRRLTIPPAEFIDTIRFPLLGLLIGLFFFAAFHKLTFESRAWSGEFFRSIVGYYLPFRPELLPVSLMWLLTVAGEASVAFTLIFPRTRHIGLLLCAGFACFVGSMVYGFGAIVLAAVLALGATASFFEPLSCLGVTRRLRRLASARVWRFGFVLVIGTLFLLDHVRGFTLADRAPLFARGQKPTTADVLTLMQYAWFILSTAVLVCGLVSVFRRRSSVVVRIPFGRSAVAYVLPVFLACSELGLYTGVKTSPGFTMFSGLSVRSCAPNHYIVRDRLLNSFFHRDLVLVTSPEGDRIGMPILSLQARWDRARRHGVRDPLVETYQNTPISRLRARAEEPFRFEDLGNVEATSWLEVVLPRRLFFLDRASETALRCSMPDLFPASQSSAQGRQGR